MLTHFWHPVYFSAAPADNQERSGVLLCANMHLLAIHLDLHYKKDMVYQVIKTVKGRRYIYEQRTWREGKHVRTESRYVGPADGGPTRRRLGRKIAEFIKANMTPRHLVV